MWQNAADTIRTTLNLTKSRNKFSLFFAETDKTGVENFKMLGRFFPRNYHYFNILCKEHEVTFDMIIVKCVAKCYKHHQYDFELDRKSKESFFNSSDGRVVWSVRLLSCRLGLDSESGQTNDFNIGIHSFPA